MQAIPSDLWQKIHRLELKTSRLVNTILGGQYLSVFKGTGLEFEEVRPYQEEDDERYIDWNVSARTGHLYVKQFIEERELVVLFVVDISPSVYFGSARQLKIEQALEFCASVAFSALRNHDRIGLLTVDSSVRTFLPPKKGRRHTLRLLRELLLAYQQVPPPQPTSLAAALTYAHRILHRRSVVFILSDFLDPAIYFPLKVLRQRHDCVAVMLQDQRDRLLPEMGLVELYDPETGEAQVVDLSQPQLREAFSQHAQQHFQDLNERLKRMAIDRIELDTALPTLKPLLAFFKRRRARVARLGS